jgi:hypothetical protein
MNNRDADFEEDIESEDLDLGEDVTDQFEVKHPLGIVALVRLRLTQREMRQLDEIAHRTGMSRTDVVLASLRATLADEAMSTTQSGARVVRR